MSESVEQAAREVLAVARVCGEIPVSLALALVDLKRALEAASSDV